MSSYSIGRPSDAELQVLLALFRARGYSITGWAGTYSIVQDDLEIGRIVPPDSPSGQTRIITEDASLSAFIEGPRRMGAAWPIGLGMRSDADMQRGRNARIRQIVPTRVAEPGEVQEQLYQRFLGRIASRVTAGARRTEGQRQEAAESVRRPSSGSRPLDPSEYRSFIASLPPGYRVSDVEFSLPVVQGAPGTSERLGLSEILNRAGERAGILTIQYGAAGNPERYWVASYNNRLTQALTGLHMTAGQAPVEERRRRRIIHP